MALVMNSQNEAVKVQAFGNWFEFKPEQVKNMQDNIALFLCTNKAYLGFVGLPEDFDERAEEEKKQIKTEAKRNGINRVKEHLQSIIKNLEVSLQRDLEQANIKSKSTAYASDGEMEAYRKLAKLKSQDVDAAKEREVEIERLRAEANGNTN
jgi:hypothetical protein